MPVGIDVDIYYPGWGKTILETCDPADDARIQAGKDWYRAKEIEYLTETRDTWFLGFNPQEHPWRAEFLPKTLRFETGKSLPDFVYGFPGDTTDRARAYLVSGAMKDVIEARKSDLDGWQFFPVNILHKDGSAYDTYYVWWVHKVADAIDETSEGLKQVASGPLDGRHMWTHNGPLTPERLRVYKDKVEGLNAWIDFRYSPTNKKFISDSLFAALEAAKLTGFSAETVWTAV